jgi:hypothetical protein
MGADSATGQYFVLVAPIQPAQAPAIVDLIVEGPSADRFTSSINHFKWSDIKERLRLVKRNDLFDPIRAVEICLVPNIVVQKILEC